MVAIKAHFDGKVFVPDEAVDLPRDQRGTLHFQPALPGGALPPPTPGATLMDLVGSIGKDDLELMSKAIEDECERVDEDGW